QHDAARNYHERSLRIREQLARKHPHVPDYQRAVAASCVALAAVELNCRRPANAILPARRAVELLEPVWDVDRDDLRAATWLLDAQTNLALAFQQTKQFDEASAVYSAGLQIGDWLRSKDPDNIRHMVALSTLCQNRGNIELYNGRPRESLEW